jgi:hypothetical protein
MLLDQIYAVDNTLVLCEKGHTIKVIELEAREPLAIFVRFKNIVSNLILMPTMPKPAFQSGNFQFIGNVQAEEDS